jgi:hypothetical protein
MTDTVTISRMVAEQVLEVLRGRMFLNDGEGDEWNDDEVIAATKMLEAEIERMPSGGACPHVRGTVTQHCSLNFTLTAEEREAVRFFSQIDGPENVPVANKRAAILRSLLERLK